MNKLFLVPSFFAMFLSLTLSNFALSYDNYNLISDRYYNNKNEAYLRITKIEQALFGRSFNNSNIYARLDRIEKKLFKTTNSKVSLAERLDIIYKNINPIALANSSYSNTYKKRTLKKAFNNIINTTSNITGITPPVYEPVLPDCFQGHHYNHFQYNNNGFYNHTNDFNSASTIRILN